MHNYRVLIFDKDSMTATIQFEGRPPLNYNLPIVDGKLPTGEAWEFWVQSLYLEGRPEWLEEITNVTNTEFIESLVNKTPFPIPEQTISTTSSNNGEQPVSTGLEEF